jgi:ParB-like chromosome segregation protein Spo0J
MIFFVFGDAKNKKAQRSLRFCGEFFMLKTEIAAIPFTRIDTSDHVCLLGLSVAPATTLVESIAAVGLINAPVVAEKQDGVFRIVCGFRRIHACMALGWKTLQVRIIPEDTPPFDLLQYAICDNRSHRPLNIVEQAQGIHRLSPLIAPEKRREVLASLLGFPANEKVFEKITRIGLLPRAVQLGILQDQISVEAAVGLATLAAKDAETLFELLANLKMSQNKEKEIITLIKEIAVVEDREISGVLDVLGIDDVMQNGNLNRNEKGAAIRKRVKEHRFPMLAAAEKRFKQNLRDLKLPECMQITPPPYFEGQSYVLRLEFKTLNDLDRCCEQLKAMVTNPAAKKLLAST